MKCFRYLVKGSKATIWLDCKDVSVSEVQEIEQNANPNDWQMEFKDIPLGQYIEQRRQADARS